MGVGRSGAGREEPPSLPEFVRAREVGSGDQIAIMGPDEYTRALGHDRLVDGERTLPKKKTLWSGLKNIFHQRHRTPSRLELSTNGGLCLRLVLQRFHDAAIVRS